mmetsp:Transcript_20888/g.49226  ORF Transcript_20888/g.49226 Transcript_20888/m.49226 type:complete len:263 (+) Transcript_20888:960-1748(+)
MFDNRGLTRRSSLQHSFIIVSAFSPEHVDIKVNLCVNGGRNNSSHSSHDRPLDGIWQIVDPSEKRKLHHRIANTTVVEFFHKIRIQVAENSTTIGNQKLATLFGCFETNKGCGAGGTSSNELVVHTNEKVLSTFFVDRFIDRRVFLSVSSGSSRNRLERVLADFHLQGVVEQLEAILLFHQIKSTKDDSTVVLHLLFEFHGVLFEVGKLRGLVACNSKIGGRQLWSEFWKFLLSHFFLERSNIGNLFTPYCQRRGWSFDNGS